MDNFDLKRKLQREKTIIQHLLKFLGQTRFSIDDYREIQIDVELNDEEIPFSKGIKFIGEDKCFFFENNEFLDVIRPKSIKLLQSYSPPFQNLRIIILPDTNYIFEYSNGISTLSMYNQIKDK